MSKPVRIAVGFAISAICFWVLFRGFDFRILRSNLLEAKYAWFLPAIVLFLLNMTLRGIRWKILLSSIKPLPFKIVFPALNMGFFANNVLPARGGEVVRAMMIARQGEMSVGSVFGSIIAERLGDMIGLLLIVCFASHLLPWSKLPIRTIAAGAVFGGILSAVFVRYAKKHHDKNPSASGVAGKIVAFFNHLTEGFLALQSFTKTVSLVLLSWAIWTNELLMPFFISRALHLDLNFFEAAGLMTGLSVGVMIPAAPGYLGTYEFFGKSVLVMLGKPAAASIGFVVVLHFFQLTMMALLALATFLFMEPVPNDAT